MGKNESSLEGASILVIEDHARLLRNMAFLLQVAGANVLTAKNSAEALPILARKKPDLILSDFDMPDGGELLRQVRTSRRVADTPFVAMSEKYELHDLMNALDQGANDYLPKPFDGRELVYVVSDNLANQHHRRLAS